MRGTTDLEYDMFKLAEGRKPFATLGRFLALLNE